MMLIYGAIYQAKTIPSGEVAVYVNSDGVAIGEDAINQLHQVCHNALLAIRARREPMTTFDPTKDGGE